MKQHIVWKYQAQGNAYLVVDAREPNFNPQKFLSLCDPHYGLGADGLLCWTGTDAPTGHACLRIFNPDGSEAEVSGNGLRIFACFLRDIKHQHHNTISIQLQGNSYSVAFYCSPSQEEYAYLPPEVEHWPMVNLGSIQPSPLWTNPQQPPPRLQIGQHLLTLHPVALANPHCVLFLDEPNPDVSLMLQQGPILEHHPYFPQRTNVQWVYIDNPYRLNLWIWERGAGWTLSSGSSSAAAVGVSMMLQKIKQDAPCVVHMPGGDMVVAKQEEHMCVWGPVQCVARCEIVVSL